MRPRAIYFSIIIYPPTDEQKLTAGRKKKAEAQTRTRGIFTERRTLGGAE